MVTRPVRRSSTGWLPPWWPNRSRVGRAREDRVDVAIVREDLDLHAARAQRSQDVAFDTVIDDYDLEPGPLAQAPTLPCPGGGGRKERRVERFYDVAESFRHLAHEVLLLESRHAVDALV